MNNQECKARAAIILIVMSLHFILTVFLQINAVVVVIILMIHMLNCKFLTGKSCTMYIVLLPIMLITTGIGSIFLSA